MELEEYLYNYVIKNNLQDLYKGIITTDNKHVVANYNSSNNLITYNPTRIDNQINHDLQETFNIKIDNQEYKEFYYKYILLHELRHMYQDKLLVNQKDNSILRQLLINNRIEYFSGLYYYFFHDLFISERDANLNSLYLLENEYKDSTIIKRIQIITTCLLIKDYKRSSPIQILNEYFELSEKDAQLETNIELMNKKYSLYEKLYYGFPITNEELIILEEFRKYILSLNQSNNNTKVLINKFKKGE